MFTPWVCRLSLCRQLLILNASQRFLVMFVFAGGLGIPGFFKVRTVTNTKVSIKLNQTPQISFHYIAVPFITIVVLLQAISVAFDRFPDSEDVDLRTWFLWFLYTPVRLNHNSFFYSDNSSPCKQFTCITENVLGIFVVRPINWVSRSIICSQILLIWAITLGVFCAYFLYFRNLGLVATAKS